MCRESDAIITYLTEKYDPEHKISFDKFEDKIKVTQWLFFQSSGQGCALSIACFRMFQYRLTRHRSSADRTLVRRSGL